MFGYQPSVLVWVCNPGADTYFRCRSVFVLVCEVVGGGEVPTKQHWEVVRMSKNVTIDT